MPQCPIATDGLNRIHVLLNDGTAPSLIHKVSENGVIFGASDTIQTAVTWAFTAAGGPYLHIDKNHGLLVAFVDEPQNRPYYAYSADAGATWSISKATQSDRSWGRWSGQHSTLGRDRTLLPIAKNTIDGILA